MDVCCVSDCSDPTALGMESGAIQNSSITASSYNTELQVHSIPQNARLGQNFFWSNNKTVDQQPWIQVDFGSVRQVTGLQTEGHDPPSIYEYYVKIIQVKVGLIETELAFIKDDSGEPKVR